jgi:hypothetical protein
MKVNENASPVPSGQSGVVGWIAEPSSDHAYVHGPFGHVEPAPLKLTTSPATGEDGVKLKLAVGAGGGDGGGVATGAVGAELAELDPPSLVAATTTRIMWPVSFDVSV